MIYGACNQIDEHGNKVGLLRAAPFDLKQLLLVDTIVQPTVFLRHQVIESVGMLDTHLHYAMDYDLWLRAALHFQISALDVTLANFRAHPGSKSFSHPTEFLSDLSTIIERTFNDPALPVPLRDLKDTAYAHAYLQTILFCYSLGQLEAGKSMLAELLNRYPPLKAGPDFLIEMLAHHLVHVVDKPWLGNGQDDEAHVEAWLAQLLSDLPRDASDLQKIEPKVLGRMHLVQAFEAYHERDLPTVRSQVWRAIQRSPSYLSNRGVLSIFLESVVGSGAMSRWRQIKPHAKRPI